MSTMTTQAAPDLFKTWKELYDRSEELWSKPMQEMLGTESFVQWMSATREQTLTQQQMSRESLEKHWDSMRLPTKTDLARLAGQMVDLEAKVEALDDRIDVMEGKIDALFNRLDLILERLDSGMTVRTVSPERIVESLPSKSKRPSK
jgi:polyhydroxyalkanoic acid synthase PhaR subunit